MLCWSILCGAVFFLQENNQNVLTEYSVPAEDSKRAAKGGKQATFLFQKAGQIQIGPDEPDEMWSRERFLHKWNERTAWGTCSCQHFAAVKTSSPGADIFTLHTPRLPQIKYLVSHNLVYYHSILTIWFKRDLWSERLICSQARCGEDFVVHSQIIVPAGTI